jgi:prepilin-type N-terminal cleavage/methylation domain-containing protein
MRKGFTLVEIVMIIVILAILAVVASLKSVDLLDMRAGVAANRIGSDVRYAQRTASAKNLRTWVVFDESAEEYGLYQGEDRGSRVPMIHPLTKGDFVVRLNEGKYAGVEILEVDFDRRDEVAFDSMGTPYDEKGRRLAADGRVTLTGSVDITVSKDTGVVKVER